MTNDKKDLAKTYVTLEQIENDIVNEVYQVFSDAKLTVCCLYLQKGFVVVGGFYCVNQEDFDEQFCKLKAKEDAKNKALLLNEGDI